MKRALTFIVGLLMTINIVAQTNPSSEEDFKNYILSQLEDYDPIMGIYLQKKYNTKSVGGSTQTQEYPSESYKFVVYRKGACFVYGKLPSINFSTSSCNLIPTSTPGFYLMDPFRVQINSQGNIEWSYEVSLDDASKYYKVPKTDLIKMSYKEIIKHEWIKLFPTRWDIEQAIKVAEVEKETIPSTGTGFAISSSGLIVTNYHVIAGAKNIAIKGINSDLNISYNASVIVSDIKSDLAILKVDDPKFTGFNALPYMIRVGSVDVGENIFVLGYPLTATMGEEIKLTNGIISSKTGYEGDISTYQISAPVQPGNSGAPLFDSQGNIVGIVSAKHTQAENAGYAIKVNYLQNLFDIMSTPPKLPLANTISTKSLPEKVKVLSNFVFIISINDL